MRKFFITTIDGEYDAVNKAQVNVRREEMVDAVVRMAKEYDIPFKDDRKERGIPIVDSRGKMRK